MIFQTLIHTPLLRDYFLGEKHKCKAQGSGKCLVCEVSKLFQVSLLETNSYTCHVSWKIVYVTKPPFSENLPCSKQLRN